MEYVIESIRADWQTFLRFAPRFVYGLVLLIVFLLAARYGGRLVASILERSAQLRANAHFLQNLVTWSIVATGFLQERTREAGMTFSTDVSSGIDIQSSPDLKVEVLTTQ